MNRPKCLNLPNYVNAGDAIVFDLVSRMRRNEEDIKTYFEFCDKEVHLVFLNEHYVDTEVYVEKLIDKVHMHSCDEDN